MLFEIRRYHFNPALFAAYREWAKGEAVPYLARELDLVGFWVSNDEPAQIKGEPQDKERTPQRPLRAFCAAAHVER